MPGADAVSVTGSIELYVPFGSDEDTVMTCTMVYAAVDVGPILLKLSFAKNFSVEVAFTTIETGLGALVLDVVGVEPSVV